jgi:hypothetical protein
MSQNVSLFIRFFFFFYLAFKALASLSLLIPEVTHKDTPQSVEIFWTSDQPVAETST